MSWEHIVAHCFVLSDLHLKWEKWIAHNAFLRCFTSSQMTQQNSNEDSLISHFFWLIRGKQVFLKKPTISSNLEQSNHNNIHDNGSQNHCYLEIMKWWSQAAWLKGFIKRRCFQQVLGMAFRHDYKTQIFLSIWSVLINIQSCRWSNLSSTQDYNMEEIEKLVCKFAWKAKPRCSPCVLLKYECPKENRVGEKTQL